VTAETPPHIEVFPDVIVVALGSLDDYTAWVIREMLTTYREITESLKLSGASTRQFET
jgi:hypothetical protein